MILKWKIIWIQNLKIIKYVYVTISPDVYMSIRVGRAADITDQTNRKRTDENRFPNDFLGESFIVNELISYVIYAKCFLSAEHEKNAIR